MTIKDYVLSKPNQGINEWLKDIESDRLTQHEKTILDCADHFNKIKINHSADFKNTVK